MAADDGFPWHLGVFDAHCHPTDTVANLKAIPSMRAKVLTIMATRAQDQELVAAAADDIGVNLSDAKSLKTEWSKEQRIIPAFGWHPWFSHQMFDQAEYNGTQTLSTEQKRAHYQSVLMPRSDDFKFLDSLPDPRSFGHFISQTRRYLQRYPVALVGEVGLDKSFRIPESWLPDQLDERNDALTPGGREGRKLSPYRVSMDHQRKVLLAQLHLAGEMQRAVSCHGVQAHGIVHETLASTWHGHERKVVSKKEQKRQAAAVKSGAEAETSDIDDNQGDKSQTRPYPPRVCLHSFSGPADTVKQYIAPSVPCDVYFSFSTTINSWADDGDGKVEAAVRAVPDNRVLIESDLHTAGDRMDDYLEEIVRKICDVKEWRLDEGVERLGENWKSFVFG